MIFTLSIKDTTTGEVVQSPYELSWYRPGDEKGIRCYWSQGGSMTCDCNRSLFFCRSKYKGLPDPFDKNEEKPGGVQYPEVVECNKGPNRFLLNLAKDDGEYVVKEF